MTKEDFQEIMTLAEQARSELAALVNEIDSQFSSIYSQLIDLKMKMDQVDYEMNYIVTSTETLKSGFNAIMQKFNALSSGSSSVGGIFANEISDWIF